MKTAFSGEGKERLNEVKIVSLMESGEGEGLQTLSVLGA